MFSVHAFELGVFGVCPRQELIDLGEDVAEIADRFYGVKFCGLNQRGDGCKYLAPLSEPTKRAFLRFNVIGRMERSTVLLSSSIWPSSMKRIKPSNGKACG